MEHYVYHFKAKIMAGTELFPLNDLKHVQPMAYSEHVKKYEGREYLLEEKIPFLNCLWNDVLHFSPIHPQIILDTWREEGLYEYVGIRNPIEVFKIPAELLQKDQTVCFQSYNFDFDNYDPDLQKYWKFDPANYVEQNRVDPKQLEIWKKDFKAGRSLFWYSHTLHILARQKIETQSCEVIVCR